MPTSVENINQLQSNKYRLIFDRIPTVEFFCTKVSVPSVALGRAQTQNPFLDFYLPGDKLDFGTSEISFLVDEELETYKEIFNWLKGMGFPNSHKETRDFLETNETFKSDASVYIASNSGKLNKLITFEGCFPISLGSLDFVSDNTDSENFIGQMTLSLDKFELEFNI